MSWLRRAAGNNSPERPSAQTVDEAGGAKVRNFRPGAHTRMISGESSVSTVMLIAWMRRPTDRPIISCTALPEENSVIYFPFSSGSAASAPSLSTISKGFGSSQLKS